MKFNVGDLIAAQFNKILITGQIVDGVEPLYYSVLVVEWDGISYVTSWSEYYINQLIRECGYIYYPVKPNEE